MREYPLFPLGFTLQVGYMDLYRPDETARTRDGSPVDPPHAVAAFRLVAEAKGGDWDEATKTITPERVEYPRGWEYLAVRITHGGTYREHGWYTEAELLDKGYKPPLPEGVRRFKEWVDAQEQQTPVEAIPAVGASEIARLLDDGHPND